MLLRAEGHQALAYTASETTNRYNLLRRQLAECRKTWTVKPHIPPDAAMPLVVICPGRIVDVRRRRSLQCYFWKQIQKSKCPTKGDGVEKPRHSHVSEHGEVIYNDAVAKKKISILLRKRRVQKIPLV